MLDFGGQEGGVAVYGDQPRRTRDTPREHPRSAREASRNSWGGSVKATINSNLCLILQHTPCAGGTLVDKDHRVHDAHQVHEASEAHQVQEVHRVQPVHEIHQARQVHRNGASSLNRCMILSATCRIMLLLRTSFVKARVELSRSCHFACVQEGATKSSTASKVLHYH